MSGEISSNVLIWKNAEPDIKLVSFEDYLRASDIVSAVRIICDYLSGRQIFISKSANDSIQEYIRTDTKELGGLLIGSVISVGLPSLSAYNFITVITDVLKSQVHENSGVYLRMGTEIWQGISEHLDGKKMVVGWYHSHPNLGAFFSGVDRRTQKGFFNHPYSIGLVIDPIMNEQKCFFGAESAEYSGTTFPLEESLHYPYLSIP